MEEDIARAPFRVSSETPVAALNCAAIFEQMVPRERLYALHIAKAAFAGGLAVFLQVSPESAGIFCTLYRLFAAESLEQLKQKALTQAQFTEAEWSSFLMWAATFYANHGNYRGVGDSKIIPDLDQTKLTALMEMSAAAAARDAFLGMYMEVADCIFSLTPSVSHLASGVGAYCGENVTQQDVDRVEKFLRNEVVPYEKKEYWLARIFKEEDGTLIVKFPAADTSVKEFTDDDDVDIRIVLGDYDKLMERVRSHLIKAEEYEDVESSHRERLQGKILARLAKYFRLGHIHDHKVQCVKEACRLWLRDIIPSIDFYVGFTETEPLGNRFEFTGLVAAVNKDTSKKYEALVDNEEKILELLPWGRAYEKNKFLLPECTNANLLAFAGSSVPASFTLPKYDCRWQEGSKTTCFSNVVSAASRNNLNFLIESDRSLIANFFERCVEVQAMLHECIGHGSGKLFEKGEYGLNFDRYMVMDLITGKRVQSWYGKGETWESRFGELASAYEECRAEAVGLLLSCDKEILGLLDVRSEKDEITYANWLSVLLGGLMGLEHYSTEKDEWKQSLAHARYVLLRVCLKAGIVTVKESKGIDGEPDLVLNLDRTQILSIGKPALSDFLKKLQAYKSTGDAQGGTLLFAGYNGVGEEEQRWRTICVARRRPRTLIVQPNIRRTGRGEAQRKALLVLFEETELIEYPETAEGIIQSFFERYETEVIDELEVLWKADHKYFPSVFNKD